MKCVFITSQIKVEEEIEELCICISYHPIMPGGWITCKDHETRRLTPTPKPNQK